MDFIKFISVKTLLRDVTFDVKLVDSFYVSERINYEPLDYNQRVGI
jgi:hypothetical protein